MKVPHIVPRSLSLTVAMVREEVTTCDAVLGELQGHLDTLLMLSEQVRDQGLSAGALNLIRERTTEVREELDTVQMERNRWHDEILPMLTSQAGISDVDGVV